MSFINPSYGSKTNPLLKKNNTENVRKMNQDKPRKKRSDSKFDIRVHVTEEEKRVARFLAVRNRSHITPFCSSLVKKALTRSIDYPEITYRSTGKPIEIKLEGEFNDLLMNYVIEWDCSKRKAAHRILTYMLRVEGGVEI